MKNLKEFIKFYINLMNQYVLIKAGTVLLILIVLTQLFTIIHDNVKQYQQAVNQNLVSESNTVYYTENWIDDNIIE